MSGAGANHAAEGPHAALMRDCGPLGPLPQLSRRQVHLDEKLGLLGPDLSNLLAGWAQLIGGEVVADRFEVLWRAAGLQRPGVVAHLSWPRLRTRIAVGMDPTLAHALVDRLLGFERTVAESRLQVSPVEWGVLSFLAAEALDRFEEHPGPFGGWDLTIDRVSPDAFDITGLGPIVTYRWRVRLGATIGSARCWFPESLLNFWLPDTTEPRTGTNPTATARTRSAAILGRFGALTSEWRAEAGQVTLAPGSLVAGRLLLIDHSPIAGTVASPAGRVDLVQLGPTTRRSFSAQVEPGSRGDRLILASSLQTQPTFRKPTMSDPATRPASLAPTDNAQESTANAPPLDAAELAVTLTVELGRVHLPLTRLANLRPGDVVELARHASEPVDLSSNGQLVARGELVQVDTELGVRITRVFL